MLTYRQFLNENTQHVAGEDCVLSDIYFDTNLPDAEKRLSKGTVYFLNSAGKLDRNDGPAVIFPDGTKNWYRNGKCHRDGAPAVVWPDGDYVYYVNDELHREDGPAMEIHDRKSWHLHNSHITDNSSDEYKWILLRGNPENIKAFPKGSNKVMQEYVLQRRPDLVGEIENLDPEVAEKYRHEVEIGNADL